MSVPLDYARPNGPHIGIEIPRILSGSAHAGSVIIGQGGPGAGGIDLPSVEQTALPRQVTAVTDLYGLDYRGIGSSAPLDCGIAPADRSAATGLPYPSADGSIDANAGVAERAAQACARNAATEIPYVDTVNIARDIDSIREALGLRTLSYTGTPYGTYVGEVYATLFPTTAGRVLLNSVLPPGGVEEALRDKGEGVEEAFVPFARWIAARDGTYHLGASTAQVRATVLALAHLLNGAPLPFPDGDGQLTGNLLLETQQVLLKQQSYHPLLAGLLQDARAGAIPPGAGGSLPVASEMPDSFVSAQDAIICNDTPWPTSVAYYRAAVARSAQQYPLAAGSPANIWACAFCKTPTSDRAPKLSDRGPANVQLIQNTADPSTPLPDAQETLRAFGHRAAMVTVEAAGHGVGASSGCVADVVTRFLTSGAPPRSGHCPGAD